jgi:[ribosomal protein S5]-alanine N-acetyltransferase
VIFDDCLQKRPIQLFVLPSVALAIKQEVYMFNLETPRLLLIFTPLKVIETRLRLESFQEVLTTESGELLVDFPSEWPGDALIIFPMVFEQMQNAPETVPWSVVLLEKSSRLAVGQMGFKNTPDEAGVIEIGYGVNPSKQGLGYATEAVTRLVDWSVMQPKVTRVTAECLESNLASNRVLEKSKFVQVGERADEEEGGLLKLWEYRQ